MGFIDCTQLKDSDDRVDIPLDFNGPGKVGCLGLGTAAVTVIDDQTSMVDVLYNICQFFSHESCGQCTPCREGTGWMLKIIDRMRRGQGRLEDLDILVEVADRIGIMPGTTICGLADGAGWPVKTAIAKFRPEFEAYDQERAKSRYANAADGRGALTDVRTPTVAERRSCDLSSPLIVGRRSAAGCKKATEKPSHRPRAASADRHGRPRRRTWRQHRPRRRRRRRRADVRRPVKRTVDPNDLQPASADRHRRAARSTNGRMPSRHDDRRRRSRRDGTDESREASIDGRRHRAAPDAKDSERRAGPTRADARRPGRHRRPEPTARSQPMHGRRRRSSTLDERPWSDMADRLRQRQAGRDRHRTASTASQAAEPRRRVHPALLLAPGPDRRRVCRMCLVEVGELKDGKVAMQPKVVPGCQTPVKDGTVIVTATTQAEQRPPPCPTTRLQARRPGEEAQAETLEGLLLNHPLDCPVCDKAGECKLQDYSYEFGRVREPDDRREEHAAEQAGHRRRRSRCSPTAASCARAASASPARSPARPSCRSSTAGTTPRSTSSPASRSTTSWPATSSICARSAPSASRTSSTSSASGS